MNEREYERKRLLLHPSWVNDGVIRRKCRQLLRQWAKNHREAYGKRSPQAYCDYVLNHPDRTGGIYHD